MTFHELGLSAPLLRAVTAEGYTVPTPIQSQAIPHVIAGRDLLGCAQTGTGKTAAFALPILHRLTQSPAPSRGRTRPIRVLVLAPTRELAVQIGQSFQAYGRHTGLRHTAIFGGVGQHPQTRALQQGVDVLIATPGRLLDLINQGFVDLSRLEIFVLDEADRMLDMGFIPDIRRIISRLPERRQTLLFSATMPETIAGLADAILQNPARVRIAPVRATTDLIEQSVAFVSRQQKTQCLADLLLAQPAARALVFTRTKHGADRLARQLSRLGIDADAIHGDKSQSARQRTLEDFRSNRTAVLVATDLAARGIDVEGISHVLNYDLPREPETYVHRIGRTGRAGESGIAISFCDEEERAYLKAIEQLLRRKLPIEEAFSLPEPSVQTDRHPTPAREPSPRWSHGRKGVSHYKRGRKKGSRTPAVAGARRSGRRYEHGKR